MSTIHVDVVSAEESIFSGEATLVSLPGEVGELGILPKHAPLITRIKPGAVRIQRADNKEEEFVFVVADTAIRGKDLDEAKANEAIRLAQEAVQNAKGELDLAKAQSELATMVAQLATIARLRKKYSTPTRRPVHMGLACQSPQYPLRAFFIHGCVGAAGVLMACWRTWAGVSPVQRRTAR
ncbi:MAG: F0F1 ATP synthase subunit epsilon [Aquabacterium sp.]|nr:F0F1 ATP synthase subunit epsilon [Aquabacterium sp.]